MLNLGELLKLKGFVESPPRDRYYVMNSSWRGAKSNFPDAAPSACTAMGRAIADVQRAVDLLAPRALGFLVYAWTDGSMTFFLKVQADARLQADTIMSHMTWNLKDSPAFVLPDLCEVEPNFDVGMDRGEQSIADWFVLRIKQAQE